MANLIFFVTQYDDQLYLKDKTVYPVLINNQSYSRSDFGIAIIYSYDGFVTSNIDLSDSSMVSLVNTSNDYGEFHLYLIPVWIPKAYAEKQIVYHDNVFYASLQDGNQQTPSLENAFWQVLTEDNAEPYFIQHNSMGFPLQTLELISDIPETESFILTKKPDNLYELSNNMSGIFSIAYIELYDYENRLIEEVTETFAVPDDGVYRLKIGYTDISAVNDQEEGERASLPVNTAELIITHMDSIECCYKKMIQALYCKGSTFCVDGDCFKQREVEYKINEMSNLYFTMYQNMNVSRMQFFGIMNSSASKEKYVQDVGRLIKVMKLIRDECKNCCDGNV